MRRHRDPKVEFLTRHPLFEGCPDSDVREVAAIADEICLPLGRRLITEGAAGEEFILIVSGRAAVFKQGERVAIVGPGDFVGEIALVTGRPRSATVIAISPVTVLVIARPRFLVLLDRLPAMRARLEAVMPLRDAS